MLGGAVGQTLKAVFPDWAISAQAFALVGMGGFFAGVSKAPLASILMVSEMAGSYSLLVPLMLVCGLDMAVSRALDALRGTGPQPGGQPGPPGRLRG